MNATDLTAFETETAPSSGTTAPETVPMITFHRPTELRDYRPPEGTVLVGHNHITRGTVFVIGGAPGVGKSRASVALAVAGATAQSWFGLTVHRKFKTLIIQNENGRYRLSKEFSDLECEMLDQWVCISSPPPCGLPINHPDFCQALVNEINRFQPDIVLIDPWNAVATDDKARDYLDAFNALRRIIPANDNSPALGIVAHTRKPKVDERASGRRLLNTLAGSYVLASIPRSAFVLQPATDAPEDNRVVFTCCKNTDGEMDAPSAWTRGNGLFHPVDNFDWKTFHSSKESTRANVIADDLAQIFDNGSKILTKQAAVTALMDSTGYTQSTAYNTLSPNGRFASKLSQDESGNLRWIADAEA